MAGDCAAAQIQAVDDVVDAHTETFTLAAIRNLPGPLFPLARKQGIPFTDFSSFSSFSLKTFPEMRP